VTTETPRRDLLLLILILAALTAGRFAVLVLSPLDLHGDEAQYWSWAKDLDWGYYTKPPMIAFVIAGTTELCGEGAWCARAGAPLLHAGTALALYFLGELLYGPRVGFWAGLLYATLPSVALSSLVISTDVPLLFFFAVGLLAFARVMHGRSWSWAVVMGVALGLGLLSKYAMAYLLVGAAVFALSFKDARWWLASPHLALTLVIGGAILSPNILWNLESDWATVNHVGQNANLGGDLFHPAKLAEFLASQAAVIGPIPVGVLLWRLGRAVVRPVAVQERLLLSMAVPVFLVVSAIALLSRANANWAATAYVPATVLVAAVLVETAPAYWRRLTVALHVVVVCILGFVFLDLPGTQLPLKNDPLRRMRGWEEVASQVDNRLAANPGHKLLTEERMVMAQLLRHRPTAPRPAMWDWNGVPDHHYELTDRYDPDPADRLVFVTGRDDPHDVLDQFGSVVRQADIVVPVSLTQDRVLHAWTLAKYHGE
jgi:4-amino-4-deoxy-L-arabinose transferase-like glycosyltransferase